MGARGAAAALLIAAGAGCGRGPEAARAAPKADATASTAADALRFDLVYDRVVNGRRVLFCSDRSGTFQLWEMPGSGGAAVRLRANDSEERELDESPDGRRLALLSKLEGPQALYLLDRATGRARALVRHGRNTKGGRSILGNPHWSPDGRKIAFSSSQPRPPDLRGRRRDGEGEAGLARDLGRLRAALQPGRSKGRLREPAAVEGA